MTHLKLILIAVEMRSHLYLDRLKDVQLTKDEHKVNQKHSDAREKLHKNARLSLEDLKLLIEKGDVKFSTKE